MKHPFQLQWHLLLLLLAITRPALWAGPPSAKDLTSQAVSTPLIPSVAEVEDRLKTLEPRRRNADPFGLSMYPTDKSAKANSAKERASDHITLSQALHTFKVSLINPAGKEFVVGGNNIYQGDIITLAYRGQTFAAQVTEVTAYRIVFLDVASHDVAWIPLNVIPSLQAQAEGSPSAGNAQKYLHPMEPFKQAP